MKRTYYLLLFMSCMLISSSCKKDTSKQVAKSSPLPAAFSISITHQQAITLNAMLAKGEIKNPNDFLSAVKGLKAASFHTELGGVGQSAVTTLDAPYSPESEDDDMAANEPDFPSTVGEEDYFSHTKPVTTQFQQQLIFAIRKNTIQVTVPFTFDWGTDPNTGLNTITNIRSATPVTLLPTGAYWGTVTQGTGWAVNSGPASSPWLQSDGIGASANAQEERTYVTSTTGGVEVSANANLAAFQVGLKLNANFTVQNAYNIYNQYTLYVNGQIWIEGTTYGYNQPPNTNFQGTCSVTDYGILRNS
jgi:hypothetical protein